MVGGVCKENEMKLGMTPKGLMVGGILVAVYWISQADLSHGRYLWGSDKNFSTILAGEW